MRRLLLLLVTAFGAYSFTLGPPQQRRSLLLQSSPAESATAEDYDYDVPDDAVVVIKPPAMNRLRELRKQQMKDDDEFLTLRMGGGYCVLLWCDYWSTHIFCCTAA